MNREEKTVFVADAAAAPSSSIELFRATAPRFTGHGLFHVLTELLPDAAALTVRHPGIWDAFKRRWAATPALRLLWYAPEDSVDQKEDDEIPVGAARYLYVMDYADLTPRTWRHVLAPLVQPYRGCDNLVCDHSQPAPYRRKAVGSIIKQYLVLHEIDAAVVSHKRGGILYLLNATPECTVGQLPLTVSQIPITMCVIFQRKVLTHAQWRVLQRKCHRADRLLRLDAVPSHAVLQYYMARKDDDAALTWSALLLGATDPQSLGVVAKWLEERSNLAACNVYLRCDTLRIDASALQRPEDTLRVWVLARLVAWLAMVPTQLQHTRNVTFVDLAPPQRAVMEDLVRRSNNSATDDARVLPTEALRQLYVGLSHKLLVLTAPITVLYMYSH